MKVKSLNPHGANPYRLIPAWGLKGLNAPLGINQVILDPWTHSFRKMEKEKVSSYVQRRVLVTRFVLLNSAYILIQMASYSSQCITFALNPSPEKVFSLHDLPAFPCTSFILSEHNHSPFTC